MRVTTGLVWVEHDVIQSNVPDICQRGNGLEFKLGKMYLSVTNNKH